MWRIFSSKRPKKVFCRFSFRNGQRILQEKTTPLEILRQNRQPKPEVTILPDCDVIESATNPVRTSGYSWSLQLWKTLEFTIPVWSDNARRLEPGTIDKNPLEIIPNVTKSPDLTTNECSPRNVGLIRSKYPDLANSRLWQQTWVNSNCNFTILQLQWTLMIATPMWHFGVILPSEEWNWRDETQQQLRRLNTGPQTAYPDPQSRLWIWCPITALQTLRSFSANQHSQ